MTDTTEPPETAGSAACLRCGAEVAPDALRCPNCGLTFPTVAPDDGSIPPEWWAAGEAVAPAPAGSATQDSPTPSPATPMVDPAPHVDPVAVDPAPHVDPVAVDPAPHVDPVAVDPAPHVPPPAPPPPGDASATDRLPPVPPPPAPAPGGDGPPNRRPIGVIAAAAVLLVMAGAALWWAGSDGGDEAEPEPVAPLGPVEAAVAGFELTEAGVDVLVNVASVPADALVRVVVPDTGDLLAEEAGPGPVTLRWISAPTGPATISVETIRADDSRSVSIAFDVPPAAVGVESFGRWIMLLASLRTQERAERFAGALDPGVGEVRILSSDDWPSLNPGFFVPYVGPFESPEAVLARCAELGLSTPNDCAGRFLSIDDADRALVAG